MATDEQDIRGLIERWVPAVHRGDLDDVLGRPCHRHRDVRRAAAVPGRARDRRLADKPESRLRLSLGLRKQDGRWVVTHEHHSFADDSS